MDRPLQETNVTATTRLQLDRMPQQSEMIEPDEDWTGVASSKERRKLQNRLNQRARRRRMRQEFFRQVEGVTNENLVEAGSSVSGSAECDTADDGYKLLPCPDRRARLMTAVQEARRNLALGTPQPLQLPLIVRINLLTALARNTRIMGFNKHSICEDEFISPFNLQGPGLPCAPRQAALWPPSLRPTEAQVMITHHPFLDVFPIPSLRENGIRAEELGFFDEDDFCNDIFNMDDKEGEGERPRLLVWGESWDPRGWEANVPFWKKWGWLIRGCPEIAEGTNYWRQKRGEKKLNFNFNC